MTSVVYCYFNFRCNFRHEVSARVLRVLHPVISVHLSISPEGFGGGGWGGWGLGVRRVSVCLQGYCILMRSAVAPHSLFTSAAMRHDSCRAQKKLLTWWWPLELASVKIIIFFFNLKKMFCCESFLGLR